MKLCKSYFDLFDWVREGFSQRRIDPNNSIQIHMLAPATAHYGKDIFKLSPDSPTPFSMTEDIRLGEFPGKEHDNVPNFEFPNDYKFTVNYPCRKTATGMFTDCGVWSANTAWTADPYKGLNCPLTNTKSPKQNNNVSRSREIKY